MYVLAEETLQIIDFMIAADQFSNGCAVTEGDHLIREAHLRQRQKSAVDWLGTDDRRKLFAPRFSRSGIVEVDF